MKWSLDHDQCKCIFPGIMAWSVLISLCSSFFFSQSRNWRGRSVSSIPGGVYIAPAVAGCVRFLDLAGRAGFNLLAPTDVYTGCTCVKTPDSKPNVLYISARYLKDENLLASNYWLRGLNNCCSSIVIYLLISDNFYLWYNLDEFLYDGFFCESKTQNGNEHFYYAHYISQGQNSFPVEMVIKNSL